MPTCLVHLMQLVSFIDLLQLLFVAREHNGHSAVKVAIKEYEFEIRISWWFFIICYDTQYMYLAPLKKYTVL